MTIYRIINPNNRVIDIKEVKNERAAFGWLREAQSERNDPFLELQTKVGRNWVTLESHSPPPEE